MTLGKTPARAHSTKDMGARGAQGGAPAGIWPEAPWPQRGVFWDSWARRPRSTGIRAWRDFALGDSALHAERLTETGGSRHATHCTPASVTRRGARGSAEKMDLNGPRHKETNAVRGVGC